ncbi:MAG: M50 family metallopeptidase [Planctomycetaceae bacterium]
MFGNYQPSEFDLRFSLFGIPVRVAPMFWLGSVLLGWEHMQKGPPYLLMWVVVCLISILAHEMGHALVARWMGCYVVGVSLYLMGGVAVYVPGRNHSQGKSILIALAGPTAGFLLFALMAFVLKAPIEQFAEQQLDRPARELIHAGIKDFCFINVWWGVINLIPVLPLDGGHILQGVCNSMSPHKGDEYARKISVLVGGLAAVYFLTHGLTYAGVLFMSFTMSNMQSGPFR